jgi:hypothetical protein
MGQEEEEKNLDLRMMVGTMRDEEERFVTMTAPERSPVTN